VIARNAVGNSLASPTVSFIAASVPDAPGKPYATAFNKTSITIAWTTPNNNGTPLTNFKLYQSVNSGSYTLLNATLGVVTTTTINSLVTGSAYRYKLIATNAVGDGPESLQSDMIIAAIPPSPPVNLARIYSDGSLITLSW
jgi:hypothetical protein